ncbi:MAG: DUF72 domain-containing protein [Chloroflexota bacterium]|nr:DUF72 domain-containing protein [Chloroflexota bacterium]
MSSLRIGTSGWVYKHWRDIFYPPKEPERSWLEFYAQHFDTVEINFSFYRLPAEKTFAGWRQRTPAGFRFAVKGSRYITHVKRLDVERESIDRLAERVDALEDRAGPVLWQLPPEFRRDDGRLKAFLDLLPPRYRHTLELRHHSWLVEPVFDLLQRHGVALCIPDRSDLPKELRLTANWTYVRFHSGAEGGDYTSRQLDQWAAYIGDFLAKGADVWAYFNNDWGGYAIRNASSLKERLVR